MKTTENIIMNVFLILAVFSILTVFYRHLNPLSFPGLEIKAMSATSFFGFLWLFLRFRNRIDLGGIFVITGMFLLSLCFLLVWNYESVANMLALFAYFFLATGFAVRLRGLKR